MLYVSQVGQQPAVVAVGLRAARQRWGVKRALLCPTSRTAVFAERLKAYAASAVPGVQVEIREATSALLNPRDLAGLVHDMIRRAEGEGIVFDVTAGLNFQTATISALLRDRDDVAYQYVDEEGAWDLLEGRIIPTEDLGLETLLGFHGLRARWEGERHGLFEGLVVLRTDGTEVFRFDEAYEKNGVLHGFVRVDGLEGARRVTDHLRDTRGSNSLRPRIVAMCSRKADAMRLRADGVWAGWSREGRPWNSGWLDEWRRRRPPAPGRALGMTEKPSPSRELREPVEGRGGAGPPLLLCLGADPSSTLLALCAHRPRAAVVFYDQTTPGVFHCARRLHAAAPELPVGTLQFRPTDLRGKGVPEFPVESLGGGAQPLANVTPGTKAQAWALSRIPGIHLCSLHAKDRKVTWCEPGREGEVPGTVWRLPPTLVQADVAGGSLTGLSEDDQALRGDRLRFLGLMAQVVATVARWNKHGQFFLPRKPPSRSVLACAWVVEEREGSFRARAVRRKPGGPDQEAEGELPGSPREGFWLEPVVAAALIQAGARDVITGLRWDHLYDLHDRGGVGDEDSFRTEIDVVCQFQGHFVGVSVKLGIPGKTEREKGERLEEIRQEIRAEARGCLGRFAIPALVRPVPRSEATEERLWQVWKKEGVVEIPLCDLTNNTGIRKRFEQAIGALKTTRAAP